MSRLAAIAIIIALIGTGCSYEAKDTKFGRKDTVFAPKTELEEPDEPIFAVPDTTDIHYSAKYCTECHVSTPGKASRTPLRYGGDFRLLCRCHYNNSDNYIHPVDVKPTQDLAPRIPSWLPLQDGKVTCITCHDVVIQCVDDPADKIFLKEQKLLRGAPYANRTALCFKCHNITQYQEYNPHVQLNEERKIIKERCLYCHTEIPDEKRTGYQDAKLLGKLHLLCVRCHNEEVKQPFHARHLRKPSEQVTSRIQQLQDQHNIILALDENGKITCATCHNPHEKGVIPDIRAGAKGAGAKFRHRLSNNMCVKCHPMQTLDEFSNVQGS
jgi:hypothetical protein